MDKGNRTVRTPETELLGAEDVARLVGVKETTVYKWCKQGKLPCLKVGKHWRIRREAPGDFLRLWGVGGGGAAARQVGQPRAERREGRGSRPRPGGAAQRGARRPAPLFGAG